MRVLVNLEITPVPEVKQHTVLVDCEPGDGLDLIGERAFRLAAEQGESTSGDHVAVKSIQIVD